MKVFGAVMISWALKATPEGLTLTKGVDLLYRHGSRLYSRH
jgi:hypothetical protein